MMAKLGFVKELKGIRKLILKKSYIIKGIVHPRMKICWKDEHVNELVSSLKFSKSDEKTNSSKS